MTKHLVFAGPQIPGGIDDIGGKGVKAGENRGGHEGDAEHGVGDQQGGETELQGEGKKEE